MIESLQSAIPDYYLFPDIKVKHSQLPITSPDKVNLASDKYVDISGLISYPLIQAHGEYSLLLVTLQWGNSGFDL